jgi:hypothetical protein
MDTELKLLAVTPRGEPAASLRGDYRNARREGCKRVPVFAQVETSGFGILHGSRFTLLSDACLPKRSNILCGIAKFCEELSCLLT